MSTLLTVIAGDHWVFETTLYASSGAAITALDDAWLKIYGNDNVVVLDYELTDAEMSLATNILTTAVPPAVTAVIPSGTYWLDVKVDVTSSFTGTISYRNILKVQPSILANVY